MLLKVAIFCGRNVCTLIIISSKEILWYFILLNISDLQYILQGPLVTGVKTWDKNTEAHQFYMRKGKKHIPRTLKLTQNTSYTNKPPSRMQPVLTLFRCRSSTPFRAKARPNRLLATQCCQLSTKVIEKKYIPHLQTKQPTADAIKQDRQ